MHTEAGLEEVAVTSQDTLDNQSCLKPTWSQFVVLGLLLCNFSKLRKESPRRLRGSHPSFAIGRVYWNDLVGHSSHITFTQMCRRNSIYPIMHASFYGKVHLNLLDETRI